MFWRENCQKEEAIRCADKVRGGLCIEMETTTPKISVIVPVYNVEQYVTRCLDSIIQQDMREIEIIVVDDGSTDGSGAICDQYAKVDRRVLVIHQDNQGLSMARNRGIDIARGEYIGFVDSDDWIASDMYSILYENAVREDADLSMINFYYILPVGEYVPFSKEGTGTKVLEGVYKVAHNIRTDNNFAWNKLYRRYLFDDIRFPKGKIFEDIFTSYRLVDKANRIVVSAECKYYYYQREGSISSNAFQVSHLDNIEAHIERHRYISEKYPKLESACRKHIFTSAIWLCGKIFRSAEGEERQEAFQRVRQMIRQYEYRTCGLTAEKQRYIERFMQEEIM